MKKIIAVMFLVLVLVGCGQEEVPLYPSSTLPQVVSLSPLASEVQSHMGASRPEDVILNVSNGQHLSTLAQIESYGATLEGYLTTIASGGEIVYSQVVSPGRNSPLEFRRENGAWIMATSSTPQTGVVSQPIQSIEREMEEEFIQAHGDLGNNFFYITFRGNGPDPYDRIDAEKKIAELFAQQGTNGGVEFTATLIGTAANGERVRMDRTYTMGVQLNRK